MFLVHTHTEISSAISEEELLAQIAALRGEPGGAPSGAGEVKGEGEEEDEADDEEDSKSDKVLEE